MEKVKCPNPKCGRRIFDIEEMPPEKLVLEMRCSHCGEVVRVGYNPGKVLVSQRLKQNEVRSVKVILFLE